MSSPTSTKPLPRPASTVALPGVVPSHTRCASSKESASTSNNPGTSAATHKTRYQRGDIWMVADDPLRPPVGTELWSNRPGIIVSNNVTGNHSGFVQIVYLTTSARKRSGPTHILVPAPMTGKNQPQAEAMALCEQIHTVDVSRLRKPLGALSRNRMHDIDQAIALTLSIGRNPDSYALFKKWEKYIQLHGIDMASEIQALAGHTTDQRVEALSRALALVSSERDSYKRLYETAQEMPGVLDLVQEIVTGPMDIITKEEQHA
jgi:mRNA interferase MazF